MGKDSNISYLPESGSCDIQIACMSCDGKINFVHHGDVEEIGSRFSVYELWITGEDYPFYVGKGVQGRPYDHLLSARRGDMSYKSNKIRRAWQLGLDIIIKHVFCTDMEEDAFKEEIRLIDLYGRKNKNTGSLMNLTDGGDGCTGLIHTKENREKARERMKGNKYQEPHRSDETKQKISKANIGKVISEEHRQKISNSLKGNKNSLGHKSWAGKTMSREHRQKLNDACRGQKRSDETKMKMSISQKNRIRKPLSEEHCQKISNSLKDYWATNSKGPLSESTRQKISNSLKGNKNSLGNKSWAGKTFSSEHRQNISKALTGIKRPPMSEEHRKKIGMANKNKIRGPLSEEHRQKLIKSITGRVCSEETRQKISNSLKNKTRHPLSEEHRLKISKANKNKNTGPRSEEICQKISNGLKGRKVSEETRRKISETKTGYHYPEEVRIRMRDARRLKPSPLKGRSLSIEHCQKLSDSHKGQQNRLGSHPSEETRQKIRDSLQGRKLSKEHLKNMELSRTDDYKQKVSRSLKIFYANKNQTQKNLTYLNELLCLGQ